MSLMYCPHCDALMDTDVEDECSCQENTDVEVAPGIFQSQEDYQANHDFDEARDNELTN